MQITLYWDPERKNYILTGTLAGEMVVSTRVESETRGAPNSTDLRQICRAIQAEAASWLW